MDFVAILCIVHRAGTARIKANWWLSWLLVVFVVMASVDRLPDPPAAKPDCTQFTISPSHGQPASLASHWSLLFATLQSPPERRAILAVVAVSHRSRILVLERTTDSSPPILHRRPQFKAA
ncbi:MAG TPA: hypothetical protein VKU01_15195 [Bryobacteraceae bacterium]|nr:hypothetical protein [Bryobacteraceae bacterium]